MSFILDALRKSESERQRQLGPALLNLPAGTARRGMPLWGWLVAALLGINVVFLLWLALRSTTPAPKLAVVPAPALRAPPAPAPAPAPAPSLPAPVINAAVPAPAAQAAPLPATRPVIAPRLPPAAGRGAEQAGNPADHVP